MSIIDWDSRLYYSEREKDRKKNFRKIGENVYSFFIDRAPEEGFKERDGQWEMSCEIVDGIAKNKHVLVEAGVGIGKSFAYIVPIIYYTKTYHRPVVIATSTIALQEQLKTDIEKIMGFDECLYHPENVCANHIHGEYEVWVIEEDIFGYIELDKTCFKYEELNTNIRERFYNSHSNGIDASLYTDEKRIKRPCEHINLRNG